MELYYCFFHNFLIYCGLAVEIIYQLCGGKLMATTEQLLYLQTAAAQ